MKILLKTSKSSYYQTNVLSNMPPSNNIQAVRSFINSLDGLGLSDLAETRDPIYLLELAKSDRASSAVLHKMATFGNGFADLYAAIAEAKNVSEFTLSYLVSIPFRKGMSREARLKIVRSKKATPGVLLKAIPFGDRDGGSPELRRAIVDSPVADENVLREMLKFLDSYYFSGDYNVAAALKKHIANKLS